MNCNKARKELLEGSTIQADLERHLSVCAACSEFGERARLARESMRGHHTQVAPDPAFAARVVARLPEKTPDLGWAAVRLLPATAALLLVLTAWAWLGTSTPSQLVASSPTEDLVSWVLTNGEAGND